MAKGTLRVNGVLIAEDTHELLLDSTDGTSNAGDNVLDEDGFEILLESSSTASIQASAGDNVVIREDDGTAVLVVDTNGKTTITGSGDLEVRAGAATPGKLLLTTDERTVVDGNKLGQIDFQAPFESAGTDAILVGASIHAEADATFSSSVNATELVFSTGASEAAAEKMRIASDGKVGIGTSTPQSFLQVNGSGTVGAGEISITRVDTSQTLADGSALGYIYFGGQDADSTLDKDATQIVSHCEEAWTSSAHGSRLQFFTTTSGTTTAVERMRIDNAGKVGIGTTSPGTLLELAATDPVLTMTVGGTSNDARIDFNNGTSVDGGITYDHNSSASSEKLILRAGNNGNHFYLTGDGHVGIGTSAPDEVLHLVSSTSLKPVLKIENTNDDQHNPQIHLVKNPATGGAEADDDYLGQIDFKGLNDVDASPITFGRLQGVAKDVSDGTEDGRVYISAMNAGTLEQTFNVVSGSVGIGTTAPYSPLHVHGKTMGTFSMGECILAKVVTHQSNTNLNASLGFTWNELSSAGHVFHMRFYGGMAILNDSISYTELILCYRNDAFGAYRSIITQKYAISSGTSAGVGLVYDVTLPGSGNASSNIMVTSTVGTGSGSASYDCSTYVTIHRIDVRSSGAMFKQ